MCSEMFEKQYLTVVLLNLIQEAIRVVGVYYSIIKSSFFFERLFGVT